MGGRGDGDRHGSGKCRLPGGGIFLVLAAALTRSVTVVIRWMLGQFLGRQWYGLSSSSNGNGYLSKQL